MVFDPYTNLGRRYYGVLPLCLADKKAGVSSHGQSEVLSTLPSNHYGPCVPQPPAQRFKRRRGSGSASTPVVHRWSELTIGNKAKKRTQKNTLMTDEPGVVLHVHFE